MEFQASKLTRRDAFLTAGVAAGAALAAQMPFSATAQPVAMPANNSNPFIYCLNTATIRGQKLGIVKEVEIAGQAGYQGIEPWLESIQDYKNKGGSLADLKKRIADNGLRVLSAIAFPQWIVEDDAKRAKALEDAKVQMDIVAQIGGNKIAAPPSGGTDTPGLDLQKVAERYRALLELGDQMGVVPQLELWGFSKNLNRIGQCAEVAIETGHPKACILLDVYHIYKGGSNYNGIALLNGGAVHTLHMNDYPMNPPREKIADRDRVYPGDGTGPVIDILKLLRAIGGPKALSVELFNPQYWLMDAMTVAKSGLEKMKTAVAKSMA